MLQGQGEARLDSEGISNSWPWVSHLVTTGSHSGSLGHGRPMALTSHLLYSLPGRLRSFQEVFASITIDAQGKQRDAGSGLGTEQMEGGTQMPPHPSKGGGLFLPTSCSPGAFKAIKNISGEDHSRGCPKQS